VIRDGAERSERRDRRDRRGVQRQDRKQPVCGTRPLHGDQREIAPGSDRGRRAEAGRKGKEPGEILVGAAGVADHAVSVVRRTRDDEIVDDAALIVQHAGVLGHAGLAQPRDVVRQHAAQEFAGRRTGHVQPEHVRDVEHAGVAPHRVMFLYLRSVVNRHIPAREGRHAGACGEVHVVQGGSVGHRRVGPARSRPQRASRLNHYIAYRRIAAISDVRPAARAQG